MSSGGAGWLLGSGSPVAVEHWEPPGVGWMSQGTCSAREVMLGLVVMLSHPVSPRVPL